ncbi:MAG: glycosyl hydrolase, partial [Bacteroidetes bacterium]|nr:glycosyl hydrolase [Bacteroidota bacterium]
LYLWCGGNETYPPPDILQTLEKDIFPEYDPTRYFLDMSTSSKLMTNKIGGVGDGPYGIREPEKIFTERSFPFNPETGSIGIPNYDGLIKFIPENELVPPQSPRTSGSWSYHKYLPLMDFPDRYGKVKNIRDFCLKAQLVSYEQYRALQEAFNHKMWDWYTGMLVWKNQNPWTALRGFFYDYYLDYTGGYFGYKHGAAPVHIQLNLNDSVICALNQTAKDMNNIMAKILIYDLHGKLISQQEKSISLKAHSLILLNKVELPKTPENVFFLKLVLSGKDKIVDENLYWLSNKLHSYEKLNELDKVSLKTDLIKTNDNHSVITISNPGNETAFFIRLKIYNQNNELVLPVFLTENYFTLFPGENKTVELDYSQVKIVNKTDELKLVVEGWNIVTEEKKF